MSELKPCPLMCIKDNCVYVSHEKLCLKARAKFDVALPVKGHFICEYYRSPDEGKVINKCSTCFWFKQSGEPLACLECEGDSNYMPAAAKGEDDEKRLLDDMSYNLFGIKVCVEKGRYENALHLINTVQQWLKSRRGT